ncbi:MAG: alpha/beta fold hydrolase [Alphaproteobacteria bacterium]|nr:alpha/beta fold hydrolase [Alphaproteobacteria bacterium]
MQQTEGQARLGASSKVLGAPASRAVLGLEGFEHRFETIDGIRLHYVTGGKSDGGVVLLLAGFPESWYAWRKIMPLLGDRFRIIAPDLPGQGDSDRPESGYDTQTIAQRIHALMGQLGESQYFLAGHDVGAWVAYPYAALFGQEIRRLVLMDAGIPGITLPDALPSRPDRAWRTWHFAFHVIPDLPEILITGKERDYLDWFLRRKAANPDAFSDEDLDEYLRVFTRPGGLRAGLAYYRAASISARQNQELKARGPLAMPVLALGADQGSIADMAGPLKDVADEVQGRTVSRCGHFLPEEQPDVIAKELVAFFSFEDRGEP